MMKAKPLIFLIAATVAIALIFIISSCKKDEETLPKVKTTSAEVLSGSAALISAEILDMGSHPIISQGICYSSTKTHPTIVDKCIEDETFSQAFQILVENLKLSTQYHVRAYAQNEIGMSYGRILSFITVDGLANVETIEPKDITYNSALVSGLIHHEGDYPITSKGIYYATDSLFFNLETNFIEVFDASNPFQVILEDLMPETSYFYRAFAVNQIDSAFGKTQSFITLRGIPKVITKEAEDIKKTSALVGGEVINPGYLPVNRSGICYSQENSNPDFNDICLEYSGNSQMFQILLEDLNPSNKYYFRAFAENDIGYHFGDSFLFMTEHETITDIEGNVYRIHKIGEQIWMIDNLRVTKFNNGEPIPLREENSYWHEETAIDEPAYSYYNNDESYAELYGALYNFAVAADPRNVCPEGWRVMNNNDRYILLTHIGGPNNGGDLKTTGTIEAGTGLWYEPNAQATNSSGFSAIPGGFRRGYTYGMGKNANFWTSNSYSPSFAYAVILGYIDFWASTVVAHECQGFSIRCVKE